ncbi:sarcosine oxidase subunit gamma [Sulfitobacter aestuariivivens]|uniref:Sarcosine oxidase subunit gamma n=1 Tax=Sulfitobacter aestuariivivens TaxID=2766981 RepID=A0A927D380_9RHOB|nr:sarcosine oxidase subunit gamma family protein [Sulfitobacter aestuariivivens]MBD3662442.1 sarcosine oxidase subunit gamma [Sulfitobacter aestuariivivens]
MSEPVSALKNISDLNGIAAIREIGPLGMITLRGDLSDRAVQDAAKTAGGANAPDQRKINAEGDGGVAWMSPDELLILCRYDEVPLRMTNLQAGLSKGHALAANVSDARAVFEVSGPRAREVLAKLAPVDLTPGQFEPGMMRRTRLAQVPAAFWMTDAETFRIVCFRSVAQYVFDLLKIAAQPGSEVDFF